MVVRFFRIQIEGTDETVLTNVKKWFDARIDNSDLDDNVRSYTQVQQNEVNNNYVFQVDLYIKLSVSAAKYKNIIVNRFQSANKSTFIRARVIQYDNCSHDSDNPQPCDPVIKMSWSS